MINQIKKSIKNSVKLSQRQQNIIQISQNHQYCIINCKPKMIISERGFIVQEKATFNNFAIGPNDTTRVRIFLTRSSNQIIYTRNVMKISQVLSYIGGLISAVTVLLLILKIYTQFSLEMSIGFDLLSEPQEQKESKPQDQQKEKEKEKEKDKTVFGFYGFFMFYIYKFLKLFKRGNNFTTAQKMQKYYKQIRQQLDIKILLKRIIKLQYCMSSILDESDIQRIRNFQEVTYESARFLRNLLHKSHEQDEEFFISVKQTRNGLALKVCDQIHQNNSNLNHQNPDSEIALKKSQFITFENEDRCPEKQLKLANSFIHNQEKCTPIYITSPWQKDTQQNLTQNRLSNKIHPNMKKSVKQLTVYEIPSATIIERGKL